MKARQAWAPRPGEATAVLAPHETAVARAFLGEGAGRSGREVVQPSLVELVAAGVLAEDECVARTFAQRHLADRLVVERELAAHAERHVDRVHLVRFREARPDQESAVRGEARE